MIAELRDDPSAPPQKVSAPPALPRVSVGHVGRLEVTWRTRWLIFAHVVIFVASQMVDEFVEWIAAPLHLVPAQASVLEITLGLVFFLLWSACMLALIRGPGRRSGPD